MFIDDPDNKLQPYQKEFAKMLDGLVSKIKVNHANPKPKCDPIEFFDLMTSHGFRLNLITGEYYQPKP